MAEDDPAPISRGRYADGSATTDRYFSKGILAKFEIFSYRNAAAILSQNFSDQFADLCRLLNAFSISQTMIRMPGGSKGLIAKYVDTLLPDYWRETRISANLHVHLREVHGANPTQPSFVREGFLDGHRIDFVDRRVAFDLEWNSKDQTYDRDLMAFSAFYDARAIDVGIILTRGSSLDNSYFRSLGKVLDTAGNPGTDEVYKKFGASTTWMGKLLYRLDAGRNGGCPVLAIGITPTCITPN